MKKAVKRLEPFDKEEGAETAQATNANASAVYRREGLVFIGTSGWSYKEWANDFYHGSKPKDHFQFYATQFSTVEINASFYRLPALKTVKGWQEKSPAHFIFAVKGSRLITHIKRLNNLDGLVTNFSRRIQPLKKKLGPLLWQLPPNFKPDLPRLDKFLKRLPKTLFHAIEFRHPDWIMDGTFALLRKRGVAFVSVSSMQMPQNFSVTAPFVYIRFHGLRGGPRHDYTGSELEPWAKHIREQVSKGRKVFAYFNNDLNVRAPKNAEALIQMCGIRKNL
jgi:uncharacterized protein YecE (DUF72 family)